MTVNILNLPGLRFLDFKETETEYHCEGAAYNGFPPVPSADDGTAGPLDRAAGP